MAWPSPPDYNEAIQSPQVCFADPDLRPGKPAVNALGLPWPRSGNNADVYKIIAANGKPWAVKCFTREVHGLQERYQAISEHLQQKSLPFMVRFQYLEQGIRIQGQWYPIVKMRWVEGLTLNDFIKDFLDRPQVIDRMAQLWLRLSPEMRTAQIIHGDLQHGNVLLVPRSSLVKMRLRLIDYDGMTVPALAQRPSGELGHPNYQHPQRLRDGRYDPEADRFAHLVIYTALRCIVYGGKPLWDRYDNGDNLLFREQDFRAPAQSALFRELLDMKEPVARSLAGHLLLASQAPRDQVPLLSELAPNGTVPLLSGSDRTRVGALLGESTAAGAATAEPEVEAPAPPRRWSIAPLWAHGSATVRGLLAVSRNRLTGAAGRLTAVVSRTGQRLAAWNRERSAWSRRSVLIASTTAVGVVLLAVVAGLLAKSLTARDLLPVAPDGTFPPSADLPRLLPIEEVHLQVGDNAMNVDVDRKGYAGPLVVQVDGLPDGVTCEPVILAPLRSAAVLKLVAVLDAVEASALASFAVRVGDQVAHQQSVALTVKKPTLSGLNVDPNEISLRAGEKQVVRVTVRRQDYRGPIDLRMTGLPEGVTCRAATIRGGQTVAALEVATPPDIRFWTGRVAVTATVGSYEVWRWRMDTTIQRPTGLRLLPVPAMTVKAGETQTVQVTVDRRDYAGPLEVRLDGLPRGVTCKPVVLTGAEGLAAIEVRADAEIGDVNNPCRVVLSIGEQQFDIQALALTIDKTAAKPVLRENVRFISMDGVQLWGTWYRSSRGRDAPCVLLLHQLGGHRKQEGWDRLALAFQEKGYAVLSFDFRGHGDSTAVEGNFWQLPRNKGGMRGLPVGGVKEHIRLEDFTPAYLPVLANDIAAARTLLDRLHDEGKCNVGNLIVVGAQEGATLGALWHCTECCRFQVLSIKPAKLATVPEGRHVAAAIWLNIGAALGGQAMALTDWLRLPARAWKTPITFVRGSDDTTAAEVVRPYFQEIRPAALSETIIAQTKLTGVGLLTPSLGAETAILTYVDQVLKERASVAWAALDDERKIYYWVVPPSGNLLMAKPRGDKLLHPLPLTQLGIR